MKTITTIIKKKYLLFIIGFSILTSLFLLNGDLPVSMDGPLYITLAKSLAFNHTYKDICYPGEPYEGVEHPFLYPLLLAFVLMIFSETVIGLKLVSVLFGIASLGVIYFFFSGKYPNIANYIFRHKEYKLKNIIGCSSLFSRSALVLLFMCTNLWFIFFLVTTIPETTYLLFSMLAILFLEKYKKQNTYFNMYLVLGIISLVGAYFTKTMGIFLILASVIYFVVQKQYKKAMLITFFCSLLISPWIIYKLILIPSTLGEEGSLPQTYLWQIWYGYRGNVINLLKTIPWNIIQYAKAVTHLLLPGYFLDIPWFEGKGYFHILYGLVSGIKKTSILFSVPFFYFLIIIFLSGLVVVGFLVKFRKKNLAEIYFLIYFVILLLCPANYYFVGGRRYLFPLLPFIFYYLWTAIFLLKRRMNLSAHLFKAVILTVFIIFFYGNIIPLFWGIKGNVSYLINKKELSQEERSYYYSSEYFVCWKLALWVKNNTFPNDVFMANDPPAFYLFTGRKTCYFHRSRYQLDTEQRKIADIDLEIEEKKVKYIAVDMETEKIVEKLDYYCKEKLFVPIAEFESFREEKLKVYRVLMINPKSKELSNQGVYWYNKRKLRQSIRSFENALEINSNFIGYFNLGCCYEKMGLFPEALDNYRKAIKLQPNYEIAKNRINIITKKEHLKENPKDALLWNALGEAYMANYDYEVAINCFLKATKINPRMGKVYFKLGLAYILTYDDEKALEAFKTAFRLLPSLKFKIKYYMKIMNGKIKEEGEYLSYEIREVERLLK
ncbi:tetratricopeptide repeat protein [bacterium]|nr:tetratricopeptide repeat protein [bacterium]